MEDDINPFLLVEAYPLSGDWRTDDKLRTILLTFDREMDIREVAKDTASVSRICRLKSLVDDKVFLTSKKHFYNGVTGRLQFDFSRDQDKIVDTYKKHGKTEDSQCYVISCIGEED
jgi:hypothetical protein